MDNFNDCLDNNIPFDVIYLDFKKAFDTVPHERLIAKLNMYGITGNIQKWIRSFLMKRTQRVKLGKEFSETGKVTSGIPQGSILGPVLFTLFINDLPDHVESICKIFADDTKIYNESSNRHILQKDLNSLQEWCDKWQLYFNCTKCKCLHLGKGNPNNDYTLRSNNEEITIEKCQLEKDLGITFDTHMKFDLHIHDIITRANKILGTIKRNFRYLDKCIFNHLYKSLVRSILEYGQSVWSPHLIRQSQAIERVQRRATKLLPEIAHLEYSERLEYLQLPSLKYRRLRGDLIQLYHLTHKDIQSTTSNQLLSFHSSYNTRGHQFKLSKESCNTNAKKLSFPNRIITNWNKLPTSIINAKDINKFKELLDLHLDKEKFIYD